MGESPTQSERCSMAIRLTLAVLILMLAPFNGSALAEEPGKSGDPAVRRIVGRGGFILQRWRHPHG